MEGNPILGRTAHAELVIVLPRGAEFDDSALRPDDELAWHTDGAAVTLAYDLTDDAAKLARLRALPYPDGTVLWLMLPGQTAPEIVVYPRPEPAAQAAEVYQAQHDRHTG